MDLASATTHERQFLSMHAVEDQESQEKTNSFEKVILANESSQVSSINIGHRRARTTVADRSAPSASLNGKLCSEHKKTTSVNRSTSPNLKNLPTQFSRVTEACLNISQTVPGVLANTFESKSSRDIAVWIAINLSILLGAPETLLHKLEIYNGTPEVTLQFIFIDGVVDRQHVRYQRVCSSFPFTEDQMLTAFLNSTDDIPSFAPAPVHWLLGDRVENSFASALPDERNAAELLANLAQFVATLLEESLGHCIMCHKSMQTTMPKLSVCEDELCLFQSRELGFGISVEQEILKNPHVVELLLTFFSSSLLSRREIDLDSIPRRIIKSNRSSGDESPADPKANNDELSPDELSLFFALSCVPSMAQMIEQVRLGTFKVQLDRIDVRLYRLFQWLIGGCRSSLRMLEPENQFKDMGTPYQFVFDCSASEKEARFHEHQQKFGSFFAFHGSSSFAWNSIISSGLKNLSNTKNMSYGAMKGPGIYFTTSFHTGLHYAKPTKLKQPWTRSGLGRHPRAVALCEIVDRHEDFAYSEQKCFTECTPQERANGQLHVVPKEEYVNIRYIFVYNEEVTPPPPTHHIFALKSSSVQKLKSMQSQPAKPNGHQVQETVAEVTTNTSAPPLNGDKQCNRMNSSPLQTVQPGFVRNPRGPMLPYAACGMQLQPPFNQASYVMFQCPWLKGHNLPLDKSTRLKDYLLPSQYRTSFRNRKRTRESSDSAPVSRKTARFATSSAGSESHMERQHTLRTLISNLRQDTLSGKVRAGATVDSWISAFQSAKPEIVSW